MELRHLRYFVGVADALSFTRAAGRLHVSQSSLSVQVAQLEAEVGAQLLTRQGRGIALTLAGQAFLDRARPVLALAEEAAAAARRVAAGTVGDLSVGHNTAAEVLVFPRIVPGFKLAFPGVRLTFRNLRTVQQLEGLRRGELDVGFA